MLIGVEKQCVCFVEKLIKCNQSKKPSNSLLFVFLLAIQITYAFLTLPGIIQPSNCCPTIFCREISTLPVNLTRSREKLSFTQKNWPVPMPLLDLLNLISICELPPCNWRSMILNILSFSRLFLLLHQHQTPCPFVPMVFN